MAEHCLCKAGVRGSIPLVSTLIGFTLAGALVAGCAPSEAPPPDAAVPATPTTPGPTTPGPTTPAPVELPAPPAPGPGGDCPYLDAAEVSAFNGEGVSSVQLDPTYDPPACFFFRADGEQQLSVWVYRADSPATATATVDRSAPVDSTDPASSPPGWIGGSTGGPGGAVYAVAKDAVAVVVSSNQEQSVKARRVSEQVIGTLGL